MAKKWTQAGSAFCEAANLHAKAGSRHDAATNYVDAANCYKKSDANGMNYCTLSCTNVNFQIPFIIRLNHMKHLGIK